VSRDRPTADELSRRVQQRNLGNLLDSSKPFRKFIWTLFVDAGIFYPTYSPRSPYDTAYREGRRAMGLEVLHMLKTVRPDVLSIVEREGNLLEQEITAAKPTSEDRNANLQDDADDEFDPEPST